MFKADLACTLARTVLLWVTSGLVRRPTTRAARTSLPTYACMKTYSEKTRFNVLFIDTTVPVNLLLRGDLYVSMNIKKADRLTFDSIEDFACESVNVPS